MKESGKPDFFVSYRFVNMPSLPQCGKPAPAPYHSGHGFSKFTLHHSKSHMRAGAVFFIIHHS
jgi:hypothetical protein